MHFVVHRKVLAIDGADGHSSSSSNHSPPYSRTETAGSSDKQAREGACSVARVAGEEEQGRKSSERRCLRETKIFVCCDIAARNLPTAAKLSHDSALGVPPQSCAVEKETESLFTARRSKGTARPQAASAHARRAH